MGMLMAPMGAPIGCIHIGVAPGVGANGPNALGFHAAAASSTVWTVATDDQLPGWGCGSTTAAQDPGRLAGAVAAPTAAHDPGKLGEVADAPPDCWAVTVTSAVTSVAEAKKATP